MRSVVSMYALRHPDSFLLSCSTRVHGWQIYDPVTLTWVSVFTKSVAFFSVTFKSNPTDMEGHQQKHCVFYDKVSHFKVFLI